MPVQGRSDVLGKRIVSTAYAIATVIAAGYITDGNDKGLRVNDVVEVVDSNVPSIDVCLVTVVTAAGLVTMIQLA